MMNADKSQFFHKMRALIRNHSPSLGLHRRNYTQSHHHKTSHHNHAHHHVHASPHPSKLPHAFQNHKPVPVEPKKPYTVAHPDDSRVLSHFSHVIGPRDQPLLQETVATMLEKGVAKYGASKTLIHSRHQGAIWSWADLKMHSDALARGLLKLGFEKGDRLGVWLPNTVEWAMVQYACARIGLILVNLNPAYRTTELEHAIQLVGMKGIVIIPHLKTSNYVELLTEIIPELQDHDRTLPLNSKRFPSLKYVFHIGHKNNITGCLPLSEVSMHRDHSGATTDAELDTRMNSVHPDEPHNIQFTSGTTGLPKGATLTHSNIVNNGFFIGQRQRFSENDVICVPVPLFHCFGMVIGNMAAMTHGASLVYPSAIFDPVEVLHAVAGDKCTALYGVPTMFLSVLDRPDFKEYDMSTLRTGVMAGTTCPAHLMRRVVSELHMKEVTICYGMTETSPVSFQTEATDTLENRAETVGTVHDHVECKVVDSDGNTVPISTPGELLTRGYVVMNGYWHDEKRTKQVIQDGWMHTGDLATIDENGYCRIVGRIKDMIIRGGENVFPREVEDFLIKHPSIADAQIVGVPDRKYGEELCAWIRVREGHAITPEEIKLFCKGHIAHYKIPKYYMFVEAFPMTLSGKVKKYLMREESIRHLGLDGVESGK